MKLHKISTNPGEFSLREKSILALWIWSVGRKLWTMSMVMGISLLFISRLGFAMNLQQMQEAALDNRNVVKRYQIDLDKSAEDITRVKGQYYPSVDFFYQLNSLNEDSATEHSQNSIMTSSVSWNLFSGFHDKYTLESAQLQQAVAVYRLIALRQAIQLNVALRYLEVYERRARLKVALDAHSTLEKIYQDSRNRLDVGLIGRNELLKFKVDFDNADITVKKSKADLKKSIHLLAREIDTEIALADLDFQEFLTTPQAGSLEDSESRMLAGRSDIKAFQKMIEAAGAQVKTEYSGYYPRLDLVGSYRNYDDSYVNGSGDVSEDEFRGQLLLSLNLFNGFSREAVIGKAKLEVNGLRYDMAEFVDSLKTDLKNLFIDFEVSLENIGVAEENIVHAKENLRITQLKYDEGLQRESDLLDAITSLSRAQYNYVAVVRTAFLNHFNIIRMVEDFGVK